MFDTRELTDAVEIQNRCYRLLRWVRTRVDCGQLAFDSVHRTTSHSRAALEWLQDNLESLPKKARPVNRTESSLEKFAN